MAISPELFVETPPYPPEVKKEPTPPTPLSAGEALAKLEKKLARAAKDVRSLFRLTNLYGKYGYAALVLFEMGVSEEISMIDGEKHGPVIAYTAPKNGFHDAAFELMQSYGLDPNISRVKGETPHSNGTIREFREYPSQTVKGLVFERWYDYIKATNQPTHVKWEITDQQIIFPLNFNRFSSGNPSVHISTQPSR